MLLEQNRPGRTPWMAIGVAVALLLIAFVPAQAGRLDDLQGSIADQERIQDDLHELSDSERFEPGCAPVSVPNTRPVPMLALWLDRSPSDILPAVRADDGDLTPVDPREGYLVEPTSAEVEEDFELDPNDPGKRTGPIPAGFEPVEENRSWELLAACPLVRPAR
jgi:hypothetical protein